MSREQDTISVIIPAYNECPGLVAGVDGDGATSDGRPAEATSPPYVSVIICTYNRSRLLKRALMAFATQEGAADSEIIVVDNNSTDDTDAAVRQCAAALRGVVPVRYLHEPVQGAQRARNAGVRAACGEIVAFLDDDAVPHDGWLAAIAAFFRDHAGAAAAGGPIEPEFETARPDWLTKPLEGYFSILDLGENARKFPRKKLPFGANMAIRRGQLARIMFSERVGRKGTSLISRDEFELFRRLKSGGHGIYYLPRMRVTHFIHKERLRKEWLFERCGAEGASMALTATQTTDRIVMSLWVILDHGFNLLKSIIKKNEDSLVLKCRLIQYQQYYDTMKIPILSRRSAGSNMEAADES